MAEDEKKSSMMKIVALVVMGLLLAGGISYYIANKIVADKAEGKSADNKTVAHEPGVFIRLGDAKDGLIVNVGGVNGGHYLKIGIIIEVKPVKNAEPVQAKMPSPDEIKILDTVVALLRAQKIEDFDPVKQEQLKELIKTEVNKALGSERVYNVYITNFVLQ